MATPLNIPLRKKSPRAPSIDLPDAIARAITVYEKERRHPAPVEVVAQALGYKNANNGAALAVLASLRYFGLLERPNDGMMAVSKDVEDYHFAPSHDLKEKFLLKWLRTPPLYADLLDKYEVGLPSDATMRYDLIQRGFAPSAAGAALACFMRSVGAIDYFSRRSDGPKQAEVQKIEPESFDRSVEGENSGSQKEPSASFNAFQDIEKESVLCDRIPVRLAGGRRAWLEIPTPFFVADKRRLKAQIDLLLAEDENPE